MHFVCVRWVILCVSGKCEFRDDEQIRRHCHKSIVTDSFCRWMWLLYWMLAYYHSSVSQRSLAIVNRHRCAKNHGNKSQFATLGLLKTRIYNLHVLFSAYTFETSKLTPCHEHITLIYQPRKSFVYKFGAETHSDAQPQLEYIIFDQFASVKGWMRNIRAHRCRLIYFFPLFLRACLWIVVGDNGTVAQQHHQKCTEFYIIIGAFFSLHWNRIYRTSRLIAASIAQQCYFLLLLSSLSSIANAHFLANGRRLGCEFKDFFLFPSLAYARACLCMTNATVVHILSLY